MQTILLEYRIRVAALVRLQRGPQGESWSSRDSGRGAVGGSILRASQRWRVQPWPIRSTFRHGRPLSNFSCRRPCLALRTWTWIQGTCPESPYPSGPPVLGRNIRAHCSYVRLSSLNRIAFSDLRYCFDSESLYESNELKKDAKSSAALLASKVYYFLGEYDEALSFALGAGHAFEAESRALGSEEYVETVVCAYN